MPAADAGDTDTVHRLDELRCIAVLPPVTIPAKACPEASAAKCSSVVGPPHERPSAWSSGSASRPSAFALPA
ncbi:hypothetical protein OG883_38880 [Streptomyces sp. NBC_01142]|uniref:hypothetical protein n=1 Tax=Streptomyces sp. NBC_01142 TaxID=2975865 RepID=UPI002251B9B5|nr:hypothetical protein [Streptomyces sp. NBC_01142]MCX4825707.1 hypothetical protein [Streptomyces sp. NBC_01142]